MTLTVNGEALEHRGEGTLVSLLREFKADRDRVAIMLNGNVVRREQFDGTLLKEGDNVEILTFAGGG